MIKISQLTEDTTPTSNDVVPVTDVETGATKKVKLGSLYKALSLDNIWTGIQTIKNMFQVQTSSGATRIFMKGDGNGGRAAVLNMQADHATDGTQMRFTQFVDRDSAVVGNDTYQIWAYPINAAGTITDFAQVFALDYNRTTGKTNLLMSRDSAWVAYTPTLTGSSVAGTGQTYTYQRGWYKLIGKTCHFMVDVQMSSFGTASGAVLISPPFAASSRFEFPLVGYACGSGSNPVTASAGVPTVFGANIYFISSVNTTVLQVSSCTSSTVFRVSGTYELA